MSRVREVPGGSADKESTCSVGDTGDVGSLPGKFHAQESLVGYSPNSHKESDMTEHDRGRMERSPKTELRGTPTLRSERRGQVNKMDQRVTTRQKKTRNVCPGSHRRAE